MTLPLRAPERWADELVRARASWVLRHQGRLADVRARLASRPALDGGRPIPLGGTLHRVVVDAAPAGRRRSCVKHEDAAEPTLRVELARGDERPLAAVLEPWLRSQARAAVERRLAIRARDVGAVPGAVTLRDQRSRWGSASRRGTLSFSWRLVLAPPAVMDYVVVHELAHLVEFGHSVRFWRLVRSVVPEAERHRRWLREHDLELRHALD